MDLEFKDFGNVLQIKKEVRLEIFKAIFEILIKVLMSNRISFRKATKIFFGESAGNKHQIHHKFQLLFQIL